MSRSKIAGFSKDVMIYGIGDGLGRLISLILLPILSRVFIAEDYGIIDLLTISYAFFLIFTQLGIPTGIQKFYFQKDGVHRKELVSSSIFILIIIAVIVSITAIAFSDLFLKMITKQKDLSLPIIILLACMPIELLFNCLLLLLRLNRKAGQFSLINVLRVLITPTLTYVFVVRFDIGIPGIFFAKIISLSTLTILLLFWLRKEFTAKIHFSSFYKVFVFAIPGHPGLLLKTSMNMIPRYFLAAFAPLTAVGLFGIAFRIASPLNLFIEAFNRAWNPFAYANSGKEDERALYEFIFKTFAASLIVLCSALSLYSKEILMILTPEQFHSAFYLVPGLTVYFAIRGIVLIFSTILYTNDKVKWASYLVGIQILVFLLSGLYLIPRYHAQGVVLSMVLSAMIYFLCYLAVTLKTFYFKIPFVQLIILGIVAVIGIGYFNLVSFDLFPGMLSKGVFLTGLCIASIQLIPKAVEKQKLLKFLSTRLFYRKSI